MRCTLIIGLGLLGMLAMGGCASSDRSGGPSGEPVSLEGSAWVLGSLPGRSLVPDATVTARFEDGRVAGSDGCNRYAMPFTTDGTTIRMGPPGLSTQMACPEPTMAQAKAYIAALTNARSFRRDDRTLALLDADGVVLAELRAQSQSLAGTSWDVMNLNNGRQAVVGIVSGATLTMAFDNDGGVSGSTGCNRFTATYRAEGDTLRLSSVATTRMACPDPALAEQEQAFLRALESVATLSFEGNRLDLRTADDALALVLVRKR
jgi:heat shock protein HslJ